MIWLYIKIPIIIIGIILSISNGAMTIHDATPAITKDDLIAYLIFGIFGMQFILGIQVLNKFSDVSWKKPQWNCNFFNLRQPAQFFHFAAWFSIISSIPQIILTFIQSREYFLNAIMPFISGVGILLGVILSTYIFKAKYE
jgi:hypothetical protein